VSTPSLSRFHPLLKQCWMLPCDTKSTQSATHGRLPPPLFVLLPSHLYAEEVETCGGASYALVIEVDDLIAIADELEAQ
jgi:hypothetical protein